MAKYIEDYRAAGYQGVIQVVQFKYENRIHYLDPYKTMRQNLGPASAADGRHVAITYAFDPERMLDITRIDFDRSHNDGGKTGNYVPEMYRNLKNPYYVDVRKYIGDSELFNSGINAIVEHENGTFAIARRADTGDWAFPAGAKEIGVSIEQTVRTELMEELGIAVKDLTLIALMSGAEFQFTYPNGHKIRFVDFLYHAKHDTGELRVNDHENTRVKWAAADELEQLLPKRYFDQFMLLKRFQSDVILL